MEGDLDAAGWQDKLDEEFPHGALCTWDDGDDVKVTYPVARLVVSGMEDDGPSVTISSYDGTRVLGPVTVLSYESSTAGPGLKKVVLKGASRPMLWSPEVPSRLAGLMSRERRRLTGKTIPGS